jgi:excisionase family DNA binding protein
MSNFNFRTPEEAGLILGRTYQTIMKYIHRGYIKARKLGRGYVISDEDIRAFVKRGWRPPVGRPKRRLAA